MNFLNNLIEMFGSASFWVKTLEMILALSLLVIVHEFGHYSFARLFGMRVNKFYMFFNPKFSILRWDPKRHKLDLFKRNPSDEEEEAKAKEEAHDKKASWRDTVYGIGWIPLGGYCSIAGMVDETTSADQLSEEAQPWEFRSRPAWQRLLVMIGGVLFNFLMAVVIYAGIVWSYGELLINFKDATEGMNYHESLHKVGFKDGDILLKADGKKEIEEMANDYLKRLGKKEKDEKALMEEFDFLIEEHQNYVTSLSEAAITTTDEDGNTITTPTTAKVTTDKDGNTGTTEAVTTAPAENDDETAEGGEPAEGATTATTTTTTTETTTTGEGVDYAVDKEVTLKVSTTAEDAEKEDETTTEPTYTPCEKVYNWLADPETDYLKPELIKDDECYYIVVKLDIRDRMVDSDLWGESRIENVRTTLYYDIFLEDLENIADGYQSVRNEAAFRRYKVLDLDYVEYQNAVMQSYYSMYGGSY